VASNGGYSPSLEARLCNYHIQKGSHSDPSNYRPICLTCISSKLLEAGIKGHLLAHRKRSGALSNSQHGFMTSKSTTTHLLECNFDWNLALHSHKAVDVTYLDFAKAFDSVVHSKLVARLNSYGINNIVLRWIESFLIETFPVCAHWFFGI
jgi:Reverse transcriptase (RNA-dependent DNA polymerase)